MKSRVTRRIFMSDFVSDRKCNDRKMARATFYALSLGKAHKRRGPYGFAALIFALTNDKIDKRSMTTNKNMCALFLQTKCMT